MPTTGTTDAWAFVIANKVMINNFCRRWFRGLPEQDRMDAMQMAILRIVERHHSLRLNDAKNPKAVISTWIGYQIRATLTTMRKLHAKRERDGLAKEVDFSRLESPATVIAEQPDDRVEQEDIRSQVEAIYLCSSHVQRQAIHSHLAGETAAQVKARGFRTLRERDQALRSITHTIAEA